MIGQYADAGVRNVLALRGDPPGGPGQPWVAHPEGLDHADELSGWSRRSATSASAWRRSRRSTRRSPDSDTDARCFVRKAAPAPTTRSPRCSSTPTTTSGCVDRVAALGCDDADHAGHHAGDQRHADPAVRRAVRARRSRPTWPQRLHGGRGRPRRGARGRRRGRDRAVRSGCSTGCARAALHHAEQLDGDARDLPDARPASLATL